MNEAVRNLTMILWAYCAANSSNLAQAKMVTISEETPPAQETVVYGAARTSSGKENVFEVVQPENAPNPLGNPIAEDEGNSDVQVPDVSAEPEKTAVAQASKIIARDTVSQETGPGEIPLPENGKIENELYQQGNDIIDVQAFPVKDMNEVRMPNTPAAIVTQ